MDDAAEAHRAAVVAALLGVVGTALAVAGFWSVSGPALRAVQAAGLVVSGAALAATCGRHPPYARGRASALFLLVLVPTVVMAWMIDDARAAGGEHWVPYEPAKLSMLTLSMIAPPGWATGAVAVALFAASSLAHHALLPAAVRARMSAGEPFGIIAYGAFAFILLGFRQRGYALRTALERARSERVAIERIARLAVALRDLANTPLQTLELVRQKLLADPRLAQQAERIERALERLRRLNDVLGPYQAAVGWDDRARALDRRPRSGARAARRALLKCARLSLPRS